MSKAAPQRRCRESGSQQHHQAAESQHQSAPLPGRKCLAATKAHAHHRRLHRAEKQQGTDTGRQTPVGEGKQRRISEQQARRRPVANTGRGSAFQAHDQRQHGRARSQAHCRKARGINGVGLECKAAQQRVAGKGQHRQTSQHSGVKQGHHNLVDRPTPVFFHVIRP
ncbi:hypothetical protein CtCNB1_2452 [Comamonas thiooxydans]|nr:hypothetical protein CtCNB1_2452 [Comamonas thiooxydans]